VITVMTGTEDERLDVLAAFEAGLDSAVPFQVLVAGKITDHYPSGWASARR
jgi:hypothetical protein